MLAAVIFDLDGTLVDRVRSIRQYALRFAEDFRPRLVSAGPERLAEVLIAADGFGYRPATRSHDIAANLVWTVRPAPDDIAAHWRRHFTSLAVAMDGAVEVLTTLQRLGMALGSSQTARSVRRNRNSTCSASAPPSGRWWSLRRWGWRNPTPRSFSTPSMASVSVRTRPGLSAIIP